MSVNVAMDENRSGHKEELAPYRKVVKVRTGKTVIDCTAECGHVVRRKRNYGSYKYGAPKRVRCDQCLEEGKKNAPGS